MRFPRLLLIVESLIIVGLGFALWNVLSVRTDSSIPEETDTHEVHIHADLRVILEGQAIDFNQEKYFERSEAVHFHEGSAPTVHVHEEGVTWEAFFRSLDMGVNRACFTAEDGTQSCSGNGKELRAYVNGVRVEDLATVPVADLQRVLVYFGSPDEQTIQTEIGKVTADACVQSGNCFGRDEEEQKAVELESGCTSGEPCKE